MLSWCPGFWIFCGFRPSNTDDIRNPWTLPDGTEIDHKELPEEAKKHIQISNLRYFFSQEDSETYEKQKQKKREDWIAERPVAVIVHIAELLRFDLRRTGVQIPSAQIRIIFERNATLGGLFDVDPKNIVPDGYAPDDVAVNDWENLMSVILRDMLTISKRNAVPWTNPPETFGLGLLNFIEAGMETPPHYCSFSDARAEGLHFRCNHYYQY